MVDERKYWFPAKTYGWGWGKPVTWQGRLVLAIFFVLVIIGSFLFLPNAGKLAYIAYVSGLCGLLVGICWLKGEPPRWRSGK